METTKNKSVVCSNCGGQIDVNTSEENVECPFCGTKYEVSDLLKESDAVKIQKIKSKVEQEKLKHEIEKNKNQEEKEEVNKFKKSKFSKILLIFFAIAVLLFFIGNGVFVKILTFSQAALFIVSWLMGSKIIKEPIKGLHTILAIVAFVLIIPFFVCDTQNTSSRTEKIVWKDIVMNEVLPEPKSKKGRIITNSDKSLSIYISNSTKEAYSKYAEACQEKGFNVESEKGTNSYDAYNSEGYKLRLYYTETSKEYNISLDAPIQMKENAWITTPLSKLVPEPQSKTGKVESNSEKYFTYYAGKTSKEEYSTYANSVLNAGFSKDYSSGEKYFYGTNPEGYKIDIRYQGNNIMRISITAPDNKNESNTSTSSDTTSKATEENKVETEKTTNSTQPTTEQANKTNTTTNNETKTAAHTGLSKEFKEAMDSYEAFIDEYVAFMKKYENSNGTDMSLISDYTKYMTKLDDANKKFEKWNDSNMNTEESAYYIQVQTRVNKKLLEAAQ